MPGTRLFVWSGTVFAAAVITIAAITTSISAQVAPYTAYGVGQRAGVRITANIAGRSCGAGVTVDALGHWVLTIATTAACAPRENDVVSFAIDGVAANQTVRWTAGGAPADAANGISLTASTTSPGGFSGGTIASAGMSIVSFTGTLAQLDVAGAAARVDSVTATTGGRMFTFVVGAPEFVNTSFAGAFPTGLLSTLVIVKTGGARNEPATTPASTPTSPPPPPSAGGGCPSDSRPVNAIPAVAQVITSSGTGTAFHIGAGEWLTAEHVVEGERTVRLNSSSFEASATVVGVDTARDLALLRTATAPAEALSMIEVSGADAGITVWSVGYPPRVSGTASLSKGILSRVFLRNGFTTAQTDAAVNPGNSGGPLTDGCGRVVGLVQAKTVSTDVEGLGYALATSEIRKGIEVARQTVAPVPAPVPTAPTSGLSEPSVMAVVNGIPGPSGSGLPNEVKVTITPSGIIPLAISEYLPGTELAYMGIPDATKASYGRQVLQTVVSAFPSLAGGSGYSKTYAYLTVWSASYWSFYPSFLSGTDYGCTLIGLRWYCVYPEFDVRIAIQGGNAEYDPLPWSRSSTWRSFR